jgi:hypothetical protein
MITALLSMSIGTARGAEPSQDAVSIMGVFLGKPLPFSTSRGLKISQQNFSKTATSILGKSCSTSIAGSPLSFPVSAIINLEKDCDRNSIVEELNISFDSYDFKKMLQLLTDKFGAPYKTEKNTLQNKMGAVFDQVICHWTVPRDTKEWSVRITLFSRFDREGGLLAAETREYFEKGIAKDNMHHESDKEHF